MTRGLTWGLALAVLALAGAWAVRVAQDAHLAALDPAPVVLDRDGAFVTQVGHRTGDRADYGFWIVDPPPRVVAATLALEDRRFWTHPGVDPLAVLRAVWSRLAGGRASGASTLAMQVARMQHPRPRTLWAKAVEAGTAAALTARYGRPAVLAQYLRLAPFGGQSHGIGHAAWWYFDRPASDLDWAQAALLAAVPQSPSRLALRRDLPAARARARLALAWLAREGIADPAEAAELDALAPRPVPVRPPFPLLVRRLEARARALPPQAGPILRSTVDLRLQSQMAALTAGHLAGWRAAGAQQAALMVVDRRDGAVRASVGSVPGGPGEAIDFTAAQRSPGSTLKPFLYALALDRGAAAPDEVLLDRPEQAVGIGNADRAYLGPLLPRQALANSRNVPAAALLRRVGLDAGFGFLRALGLHDLDGPASRFGLSMAIGALPSSLERLVRAYGALADDGALRDLRWLEAEPQAAGRSVIGASSARLVARFLSDPLARLPSFPRYGSSEYPMAVALKTGTSQGYRDAWTVAWSQDDIVGAWVGRADDGPMSGVGGARTAAALVQSALLRLSGRGRTDLVAGAFAPPAGRVPAELCASTGLQTACAARLEEFVRPDAPLPAPSATRLEIVQPQTGTHIWRNPETPAALARLLLRAEAVPAVAQVVWLVDGEPVATSSPDQPLAWPLEPGRHRFQLRSLAPARWSAPVNVTVE